MKKTNCPNCAAPIDPEKSKCPYCGTTFLDFSAIDLEEGKPIFLKIRMKSPISNQWLIITQKAIPKLETIEIEEEPVYAYAGGRVYARFTKSRSMTTGLSFMAVEDENGSLTRIEVEDV